ncbi:MAG: hypothetical protein QM677_04050 [Microbacterium sp.]
MGEEAERDVLRALDADIVVDGRGAGANRFDDVTLSTRHTESDGLGAGHRRLYIAEAKGGTAGLSETGRKLPDGTRAPQGSTAYFNDLFAADQKFQEYLTEHPDIAKGLADGTIDVKYLLIRADTHGAIHTEELLLDPNTLDLKLPLPTEP